MNNIQHSANLDDLAAEAIRLGREVADRARATNLGGNAKDAARAARCLASLDDRSPFSTADEGGLAVIKEIFEKDLKSEVLGTETRFIETHYDEFGQQGEMREVPIYSCRGAELVYLGMALNEFIVIRASVLDHIAAHRALLSLMSG